MHRDGILPDSCLVLFCPPQPQCACAGPALGHVGAGCARQSIAVYHNRPRPRLVGLIGHSLRCRLVFSYRRRSGMKMRNTGLPKFSLKGSKGEPHPVSKRNSGQPKILPSILGAAGTRQTRRAIRTLSVPESTLNKGLTSLALWHNIISWVQPRTTDRRRTGSSAAPGANYSRKKTFRHANSHLLDALPETLIM